MCIGDEIFVFIWCVQQGFIYNVDILELIENFIYFGEGWGLMIDGEQLIMSDGMVQFCFMDF